MHDHCRVCVYTCNLVSGTIEFNHAIDLFKTHALPSLEAMCSAVHTHHYTRIPLRLDVKQEVKKQPKITELSRFSIQTKCEKRKHQMPKEM